MISRLQTRPTPTCRQRVSAQVSAAKNSSAVTHLPAACKLHISFHGCKQFAGKIGTQYVLESGFNEWAERNGYVVLYPQTVASDTLPFNPEGCFDWWGYTGTRAVVVLCII